MLTKAAIGAFSLNVSTFLYFVSYLPQLCYNREGLAIKYLSLPFHFMLLTDYLLDLVYGFALELPWQYKLVSLVGLVCLSIQHRQLFKIKPYFCLSSLGLFIFYGLAASLFFVLQSEAEYLFVGYIVQLFNVAFYLPQMIKNYKLPIASKSLSFGFLILHLFSVALDNVNAWCLNWPMPSKIGIGLTSILVLILCGQRLGVRTKR